MKVAAMLGGREAAVVDRPDPVPGAGLALVRVTVVPMCTEYKMHAQGQKADALGHEAAGEVVKPGGSGTVKAGDRVVVMPQYPCGKCALCLSGDYIHCRNTVDVHALTGSRTGTTTYAQFLLKADALLVPVPGGMSTEHAAMACCGLGPTFGAMQKLRVDAFDTVLITGLGPVGLGGIINAVHRGARVIGVEGQPYRAALARRLGAAEVLDPANAGTPARIKDLTGGEGVDAAVDCSGNPKAQRLMIDSVRRLGRAAFVGESWDPLTVTVSDDFIRKGLTLAGSWHYNLGDAHRLMGVVAAEKERIDMLITHRFPMSRVRDAWELQITGNCGKVLLDPWS